MLLQNTVIDGTTVQVNSHGHHHRQHLPLPREEVVLCAVYHFPEPKEAIRGLQDKFPHVRFIWHTLKERWPVVDDGEIIPKGEHAVSFRHEQLYSFPCVQFVANKLLCSRLSSGDSLSDLHTLAFLPFINAQPASRPTVDLWSRPHAQHFSPFRPFDTSLYLLWRFGKVYSTVCGAVNSVVGTSISKSPQRHE